MTIYRPIGTWNVRTLKGVDKLHELTRQLYRYRWDVIGLCEKHWTNSGELMKGEVLNIVVWPTKVSPTRSCIHCKEIDVFCY